MFTARRIPESGRAGFFKSINSTQMKKVFFALGTLFLITFSAFQAPKQQEPKKVKIELSLSELNVVIESLQAQPYGRVAPLIDNIVSQFNKQVADTTKPKK
jgi:hypothetical protein